MRDTQFPAQSRDQRRLFRSLRSEPMIDCRGLDFSRSCAIGEQEQGQAVRPPGYGKTKPVTLWQKGVQTMLKGIDQLLSGRESLFNCTSP